ncbi:MAG TPA: hypothetical protein VMS40_20970 [Vicinamibacterales bacterium]|nr:hypothetical protein [Vicinamibacterales bacterium]
MLAVAQRRDAYVESRDHPAISYSTGKTTDAVSALNARLEGGSATLKYDESTGYLRSVLDALSVPVESQMMVFSQTSFQASLIRMRNPRAVFFNDTVAVGYIRGGKIIEVAAQDPTQGVVFYEVAQDAGSKPLFKRSNDCLACHLSWDTLGVPGLMVQSVYPLKDENSYANGFTTVHGSPLEQRWGGWWVTGDPGGARHIGNVSVMYNDKGSTLASPTRALPSLDGIFDLKGYLAPYSDVVALLVIDHQANMTNLITRTGWEARLAAASQSQSAATRVTEAARDLVDYMLFVDEAPLVGPVKSTSGFAESFVARGPRDGQGRSLRELDLRRRLFKYPCSYMIYTPAFEALPPAAKNAVYSRLWEVLSGKDTSPRYKGLAAQDRQAIVSILRDTKKDLPEYFRSQG